MTRDCTRCGTVLDPDGSCFACGSFGIEHRAETPPSGTRPGRSKNRNDPEFREPPPPGFTRYDLAQLLRDGVPPPQLVCGDLLYLSGVHTLTGPPDCGKTFLACHWAAGLLGQGKPVAFFDEESGPEQTAEKLIALGGGPGLAEHLHYFPFPGRQWGTGDVLALAEIIMSIRPVLVIWDSSAAFLARAGLDENAAADVTRFWATVLTPCARRGGAAVLAIDHDTKNSEPSRYARGSGAKLAASDVAFKIEPVKAFSRDTDGLSKLTITKDRRGWLHRAYDVDFTSGVVLGVKVTQKEVGEFRPTVLMGRICDALAKAGELSFRDLKARVRGKDEHVREALAVLIDDGHVKRRPGPRGAHLHELVVPFND